MFVGKDKIRTFKRKLGFWKISICLCEHAHFSILKDISDETRSKFNKCDFLILYNESCQHFEHMCHLVNQYFLMRQYMVQNHAQVKYLFEIRDRPIDFNGTEYGKFIHMVYLCTNFKKLPLVKLWCSTEGEYYPQLLKRLLICPSIF